MASYSSNDSRMDSTSGSLEIYVQHDGIIAWSCRCDADLWIFNRDDQLAVNILLYRYVEFKDITPQICSFESINLLP